MAWAGACRFLITLSFWPLLDAFRYSSDKLERFFGSGEPEGPHDGDPEEPTKDQRDVLVYYTAGTPNTFRSFAEQHVEANGLEATPIYQFDWDDTLFPTSWFRFWRNHSNGAAPDDTKGMLLEGINRVRQLLEGASARGIVLIVTNAGIGWPLRSRAQLIDWGVCQEEDLAWLDTLPVIYAPSYYKELTGVDRFPRSAVPTFKKAVIADIYRQFKAAGVTITQWFSMGDAQNDLAIHSSELTTRRNFGKWVPNHGPGKFKLPGSNFAHKELSRSRNVERRRNAPRVRTSTWKLLDLRRSADPGSTLRIWTAEMARLVDQADAVLSFADEDGHHMLEVETELPVP